MNILTVLRLQLVAAHNAWFIARRLTVTRKMRLAQVNARIENLRYQIAVCEQVIYDNSVF